MKIVHVIDFIDPIGGGPPQVVVRMAAAQAQQGHEVHVVAYAGPDPQSAERTQRQLATVPYVHLLHLHILSPPSGWELLFAGQQS